MQMGCFFSWMVCSKGLGDKVDKVIKLGEFIKFITLSMGVERSIHFSNKLGIVH